MAAEDLRVSTRLTIPGTDIVERFSTSGGPGGQHANKVETRVELRVDLVSCAGPGVGQRERLIEAFGDEIRVVVDDTRSQARNREIARERLAARLSTALVPTRARRATRPTKGSKQRRLDAKRQRSATKEGRRRPGRDD